MSLSATAAALTASIDGLRLLDHAYYRAWQDGELERLDLKGYAEQYRHFEKCLPEVLAAGAGQIGTGGPKELVEANLRDELSNPRPHLDLFDDFGASVGATVAVDATRATSELVDTYKEAADRGPIPLLAVVAAYETQAADIAGTKSASLTTHYGLDREATEFWTVHAAAELQHSAWTVEALESLDASPAQVSHWAHRSALAWWQFLDEREAARAA